MVADDVGDGVVELQLDTHDGSDRVAGEIVVGRPEPAAHDDRIGGLEQPPQLHFDPTDVVADLHLDERVDAARRRVRRPSTPSSSR